MRRELWGSTTMFGINIFHQDHCSYHFCSLLYYHSQHVWSAPKTPSIHEIFLGLCHSEVGIRPKLIKIAWTFGVKLSMLLRCRNAPSTTISSRIVLNHMSLQPKLSITSAYVEAIAFDAGRIPVAGTTRRHTTPIGCQQLRVPPSRLCFLLWAQR